MSVSRNQVEAFVANGHKTTTDTGYGVLDGQPFSIVGWERTPFEQTAICECTGHRRMSFDDYARTAGADCECKSPCPVVVARATYEGAMSTQMRCKACGYPMSRRWE